MPKHIHTKTQKTVNLALQGGGAHGAFAWGVLDKLLEDGRIGIDGICATSAGTMNACALAWGMHKGGPEKAREALHDFWQNISLAGKKANPVQKMPMEKLMETLMEKFMPQSGWMKTDDSLSYFLFDSMTRLFSPYQFNPFDLNPLRDVMAESINFAELRECDCVKLFISATHVHSGKVKVFNTKEIDLDVVMASACLPFLFKAVEVDGEDYWDGGYIGNPALFPLFYETDTRDVMIVHINPMERKQTPRSAHEIMNRINEISFNSSLLKELRAIAFVKKLVEHSMLKDEHKDDFMDILVHSIRADDVMTDLSVASKFNSDWDFLTDLRDKGRETMAAWLKENFEHIGVRDTVDLHAEFLNSNTKMFENHHGNHKHSRKESGLKRKTA